MTPEQLLAEFQDLVLTMPARATIRHDTDENVAWFGRAIAVFEAWDKTKAVEFAGLVRSAQTRTLHVALSTEALVSIRVKLQQAVHSLRLLTAGPQSQAVDAGAVFHYFDEVRKIIESANADLLFVDPYLDAEFVSKYLGQIKRGVPVRLLTQHCIPSLVPAAVAFATQQGVTVAVRSIAGMHDRYVLVDGVACYQSGASFKDGAKKAPTTLTQITDAFDAVKATYEQKWAAAKVEL